MMICDYENTMKKYVNQIESFSIFTNGECKCVLSGGNEFEKIFNKIEKILCGSRVMPAFGVSLHDETQNVLRSDVWLQINFNETQEKDGMPFDSLLFKLEVTSGINLIRLHHGQYEGRCIYLDFDDEIDLYTILEDINN